MTDHIERLLHTAESDLRAAASMFEACDLETLLHLIDKVLPGLVALARGISETAQDVAGNKMGAKRVVVRGVEWERSKPPKRSAWNTDDLLAAVQDTRLVDPHTGEVVDETPLDKVLHVWNLGAPRVTAIRDRGLNPDDFCHVEWESRQPWKVKQTAKKRGKR